MSRSKRERMTSMPKVLTPPPVIFDFSTTFLPIFSLSIIANMHPENPDPITIAFSFHELDIETCQQNLVK